MSEVQTFLRVKINGKWTNLGIVADEKDIKDHFEYVQDLIECKNNWDRVKIIFSGEEGFRNELLNSNPDSNYQEGCKFMAWKVVEIMNLLDGTTNANEEVH
ncbi:hypothetical protein [Macrococcoides bohemicum]|uniref:hypothetical protein n=1 Tax=Macrococcoides bohemicum TaxID=1903056 RepID=UPI00165E0463|nr:hypothetical protein [Macrococcus bohemicus]MBC9873677.1 hypothetical protein [Macrococcus bohemicus]